MKRKLYIIFFWVTMGLMTSIVKGNDKDIIYCHPAYSTKSDTSIFGRFIIIDSFNLSIIPPSSGVQFYKEGIVFLSSSKFEKKMLAGQLSFGTIESRYAVLKDTALENHQKFSSSTIFPFPSDAITFSGDFNTMYFTKNSNTKGTEKIYRATFSQSGENHGDWKVDTNPVSFCSDQSTYTHPALSSDEKIMIFASNRQGSLGGMDLFITRNIGGTWSAPENPGKIINTKNNELFPYLDSKNNLFFSSDGIKGYGGYDVFVCKFNGKTWEQPVNLSNSINTKFDDVAFTINRQDGKSAFYTIKQKSGKRSVQLCMVRINGNNVPKNLLNLSQIFTSPGPSVIKSTETSTIALNEPEVKSKEKIIVEKPKKELITAPPIQVKSGSTVKQVITATSETPVKKDIVVYRVQILSNAKPKGSYKTTIDNKSYSTFEYLYSGSYRTCVGKFSTLKSAIELQSSCRKSGYPQAFVIAFKNNVRSTDPKLFK